MSWAESFIVYTSHSRKGNRDVDIDRSTITSEGVESFKSKLYRKKRSRLEIHFYGRKKLMQDIWHKKRHPRVCQGMHHQTEGLPFRAVFQTTAKSHLFYRLTRSDHVDLESIGDDHHSAASLRFDVIAHTGCDKSFL